MFTRYIHVLTTNPQVILQKFQVLARDTHASVKFELSCTVATCSDITSMASIVSVCFVSSGDFTLTVLPTQAIYSKFL